MRVWKQQLVAVFVGCVVSVGCERPNNGEPNAMSGESSRTDRPASQALTVSGCLQRQDRLIDQYVLTETASGKDRPVATGGQTAVEREQLRQAMAAYQLTGMRDDVEKLVGSEVRVTGRLVERADLGDAAKSGQAERDIELGDLAELNVERSSSWRHSVVGPSSNVPDVTAVG